MTIVTVRYIIRLAQVLMVTMTIISTATRIGLFGEKLSSKGSCRIIVDAFTVRPLSTRSFVSSVSPRPSTSRYSYHSSHYYSSSLPTSTVDGSEAITSAKVTATTTTAATDVTRLFPEELNVLYDSKCNVCKLEMDWLVSRDIRINGPTHRKLKLTDLEADGSEGNSSGTRSGYDENNPANGYITYEQGMAAMYGIKYDGTVYKGVPVFELAYETVGLGWIWKINQLPAVNKLLLWGYEVFATNRTRFTRGSSLEDLIQLHVLKKEAKKKKALEEDCDSCNNKI
mmetsp:Transcript_27635/g.31410  ORF Transcript_27635/g.31410 Transcript_27635/m.31410 type:complete len:284 (+) Transcript_27635:54-905(+)